MKNNQSNFLRFASIAAIFTVILLAILTSIYSLRYLLQGAVAVDALSNTDEILNFLSGSESSFWSDFASSQEPLYHQNEFTLVGHIVGASIALLAGAIQLAPKIRWTWPLLHRASGYLYAFSALIGLALGSYVSFTLPMVGGTKAIITNVLGGALGISFIMMAFISIARKDYLVHGQWMFRSYAILMTIVTVYLLILFFGFLGLSAEFGYGLAHLLCFPINLLIAEAIIRKKSHTLFSPTRRLQTQPND